MIRGGRQHRKWLSLTRRNRAVEEAGGRAATEKVADREVLEALSEAIREGEDSGRVLSSIVKANMDGEQGAYMDDNEKGLLRFTAFEYERGKVVKGLRHISKGKDTDTRKSKLRTAGANAEIIDRLERELALLEENIKERIAEAGRRRRAAVDRAIAHRADTVKREAERITRKLEEAVRRYKRAEATQAEVKPKPQGKTDARAESPKWQGIPNTYRLKETETDSDTEAESTSGEEGTERMISQGKGSIVETSKHQTERSSGQNGARHTEERENTEGPPAGRPNATGGTESRKTDTRGRDSPKETAEELTIAPIHIGQTAKVVEAMTFVEENSHSSEAHQLKRMFEGKAVNTPTGDPTVDGVAIVRASESARDTTVAIMWAGLRGYEITVMGMIVKEEWRRGNRPDSRVKEAMWRALWQNVMTGAAVEREGKTAYFTITNTECVRKCYNMWKRLFIEAATEWRSETRKRDGETKFANIRDRGVGRIGEITIALEMGTRKGDTCEGDRLEKVGRDPKGAAERRARCIPEAEKVGKGNAQSRSEIGEGIAMQLRETHLWIAVCGTCGALVNVASARTQARRENREDFKTGDGCGGRKCAGTRHRPGKFETSQHDRATALRKGEKIMVEWPGKVKEQPSVKMGEADRDRIIDGILKDTADGTGCICGMRECNCGMQRAKAMRLEEYAANGYGAAAKYLEKGRKEAEEKKRRDSRIQLPDSLRLRDSRREKKERREGIGTEGTAKEAHTKVGAEERALRGRRSQTIQSTERALGITAPEHGNGRRKRESKYGRGLPGRTTEENKEEEKHTCVAEALSAHLMRSNRITRAQGAAINRAAEEVGAVTWYRACEMIDTAGAELEATWIGEEGERVRIRPAAKTTDGPNITESHMAQWKELLWTIRDALRGKGGDRTKLRVTIEDSDRGDGHHGEDMLHMERDSSTEEMDTTKDQIDIPPGARIGAGRDTTQEEENIAWGQVTDMIDRHLNQMEIGDIPRPDRNYGPWLSGADKVMESIREGMQTLRRLRGETAARKWLEEALDRVRYKKRREERQANRGPQDHDWDGGGGTGGEAAEPKARKRILPPDNWGGPDYDPEEEEGKGSHSGAEGRQRREDPDTSHTFRDGPTLYIRVENPTETSTWGKDIEGNTKSRDREPEEEGGEEGGGEERAGRDGEGGKSTTNYFSQEWKNTWNRGMTWLIEQGMQRWATSKRSREGEEWVEELGECVGSEWQEEEWRKFRGAARVNIGFGAEESRRERLRDAEEELKREASERNSDHEQLGRDIEEYAEENRMNRLEDITSQPGQFGWEGALQGRVWRAKAPSRACSSTTWREEKTRSGPGEIARAGELEIRSGGKGANKGGKEGEEQRLEKREEEDEWEMYAQRDHKGNEETSKQRKTNTERMIRAGRVGLAEEAAAQKTEKREAAEGRLERLLGLRVAEGKWILVADEGYYAHTDEGATIRVTETEIELAQVERDSARREEREGRHKLDQRRREARQGREGAPEPTYPKIVPNRLTRMREIAEGEEGARKRRLDRVTDIRRDLERKGRALRGADRQERTQKAEELEDTEWRIEIERAAGQEREAAYKWEDAKRRRESTEEEESTLRAQEVMKAREQCISETPEGGNLYSVDTGLISKGRWSEADTDMAWREGEAGQERHCTDCGIHIGREDQEETESKGDRDQRGAKDTSHTCVMEAIMRHMEKGGSRRSEAAQRELLEVAGMAGALTWNEAREMATNLGNDEGIQGWWMGGDEERGQHERHEKRKPAIRIATGKILPAVSEAEGQDASRGRHTRTLGGLIRREVAQREEGGETQHLKTMYVIIGPGAGSQPEMKGDNGEGVLHMELLEGDHLETIARWGHTDRQEIERRLHGGASEYKLLGMTQKIGTSGTERGTEEERGGKGTQREKEKTGRRAARGLKRQAQAEKARRRREEESRARQRRKRREEAETKERENRECWNREEGEWEKCAKRVESGREEGEDTDEWWAGDAMTMTDGKGGQEGFTLVRRGIGGNWTGTTDKGQERQVPEDRLTLYRKREWRAGDIAEVRSSAGTTREYTVVEGPREDANSKGNRHWLVRTEDRELT